MYFIKIEKAKQYLHEGRSGSGQADHENIAVEPAAEQIGEGYPYEEGACDTLQHDKAGFGATVEVTDEAKEEGGEQAVEAEGFQIFT